MKSKASILIRVDVEGFHFYPDAPLEVAFLADRHRHTFTITLCLSVNHANRDKEIFLEREKLLDVINSNYGSCPCEFGARSCEMIGQELLDYYNDGLWCEVWEENTGGARVEK